MARPQITIENPILNGPFIAPTRHFAFDDEGITDTQLLCEQVVGRGLRRRSYALGDDGRFAPEYAEVYGVPFSFIPASGSSVDPKPGPIPTDTYLTSPDHCHVSHVVAESDWEAHLAGTLEHLAAVRSYVKNQGLDFTIPYALDGQQRSYIPDFVVRLDDGRGDDDLLNLIVEVSGAGRRDKERKVTTARELWVPAVNGHGGFGRWAFIEVTDPWDAAGIIEAVAGARVGG